MTTVNLTPVNIPEVFLETVMLESKQSGNGAYTSYNRSYQSDKDMVIRMSPTAIHIKCIEIMTREIEQAKKDNPGLDFTKINNMVNSQDAEMRELGYNLLDKYTRYTSDIHTEMWKNKDREYSDSALNGLETIIYKYVQNNRFNVSGRIK